MFNKIDCFDSFVNKDFEMSVSNLDWQGFDVLGKISNSSYLNRYLYKCIKDIEVVRKDFYATRKFNKEQFIRDFKDTLHQEAVD